MHQDFREAVGAAVGDEGEAVLDEERLREILNELPDVYTLHRRILNELENRIRHWWDFFFPFLPQNSSIKAALKSIFHVNALPSHLCFSMQGGKPEDCRHLPIQKSRVLGFHHLYRPLRQKHEPAGGQLPNFSCLCSHCSPVWGQHYRLL